MKHHITHYIVLAYLASVHNSYASDRVFSSQAFTPPQQSLFALLHCAPRQTPMRVSQTPPVMRPFICPYDAPIEPDSSTNRESFPLTSLPRSEEVCPNSSFNPTRALTQADLKLQETKRQQQCKRALTQRLTNSEKGLEKRSHQNRLFALQGKRGQ